MKIAAIILLILVLGFSLSLLYQNLKTPTHLGHKNGQLAPMPDKPNAVSSQTAVVDKQVEPLPFKGNAEETMAAIIAVLKQMPGNEIKQQESHYLYSIFTTPLMHYHDDVEWLLDEQNQLVHFRSQSRAGHSDMGLNRKRYDDFRELYQK